MSNIPSTPGEAPKGFNTAKQKAEKLLKDKGKLGNLLGEATTKANKSKEKIDSYWGEFQGLLRLVQSWMVGRYKHIPWKSLVLAVAAIIYFVNPLDFIPDFLLGWGFIDDLTVIGFVVNNIRNEITNFLEWETLQQADQSKAAPKTPAESPN